MRFSLATAALLASLVLAGPALATPAAAAVPGSTSDTGRHPSVPHAGGGEERWACTPTGCSGGPARGSWSAALGFGAATLAAAGVSRRRSSAAA
jgi:hypothetical protein